MATLSKGKTFTNGETVTPQKLHELVDLGTVSGIVNADIAAGAAIADSKLAQITTAGKVLPAAVQGTAVVTADPRLSDARMPVPHTHAISDTTGLQTALDGKQAAGSYAPATGIAQSAVTNLTTDLAGKAASSHTHDDRYYTETEMNTLLAGKQASGSYAPATGIAQSAVTNLTTDLAGKAASSHTHGNITNAGAIGSTALLPVMTGTGGVLTTGFFGDLPNTFCSGTDPRLSDARQPISTHLGLVKAWVNFNHTRMLGVTNAANGESISVTAGSSSGIWNSTVAFSTGQIGIIYYITSAGAVPNASLGGINVSTLGFQIRAISGNTATIKLLAGPATASQTITGNGGTSGFQYISYGIRAQYGVSSITKAASGSHMNFTFNFSTPFDFIDYCYNFQMDARSSGDFYIQTKGQSSIQLQVLNFSDASVSSQMNFMAFGL